MSGSVVGTSDLPLELKGDPSCSKPDPDSLNLSSLPMNAPDLAPSTPPAERVRAWAQSCHSLLSQCLLRGQKRKPRNERGLPLYPRERTWLAAPDADLKRCIGATP